MLNQYQQNGFAVARQLLDADEVRTIRETFMSVAKDGPVAGLSEMRGSQGEYDSSDPLKFFPRMMHPHKHPEHAVGPVAMKYLLDERIGDVLRMLLGDEPIAAQTMFYFKPPGARGQDLHQDNFYLRVQPGSCIAAWIAVDDADEENGGMMCVPGTGDMEVVCPDKADPATSFTTEHVEPPAGKKPEIVKLKAGDVLFFNGSVIHGSFPNTSKDRFRRSLICHYIPKSCLEVAKGYAPLFDFAGNVVARAAATGGGPCGTFTDAPTVMH